MGIDIQIVAGRDKHSSSVQATGSIQHIISDQERLTFKLSDSQLKDAVKSYFGKKPNDAYLHGSTPWHDLYTRYSWPQVQTVLVVEKAEILSITSEPSVVKTQTFSNNSSKSAEFDVSISESVSNTVSSSWSTGGTLTIGQKFTYGVNFIEEAKGETSISYSQSWGVGGQKSKTVTIGSSSGVKVKLEPNESVIAQLSASRGVMKIRITYRAYLIGRTAINYKSPYKGHHFWGLPIRSVSRAGGCPGSITSTETIEVGYYSNSKIELNNAFSGALVLERSLADTGVTI